MSPSQSRHREGVSTLEIELQTLLNKHSAENGSNTPDWILAEYMLDCLKSFNRACTTREKWYGRGDIPIPQVQPPSPIDPKGDGSYQGPDGAH